MSPAYSAFGIRGRYAFSFFGANDLLAFLQNYIDLVIPTGNYFFMIRGPSAAACLPDSEAHALPEGESDAGDCAACQPAQDHGAFCHHCRRDRPFVWHSHVLIGGDPNGFDSIPHGRFLGNCPLTTSAYGAIAPHSVTLRTHPRELHQIIGYGIIAVRPVSFPSNCTQTSVLSRTLKRLVPCQLQTLERDRDARFCRELRAWRLVAKVESAEAVKD